MRPATTISQDNKRMREIIADGIKMMLRRELTKADRSAALVPPEVADWIDRAAQAAGLSVDLDITTD